MSDGKERWVRRKSHIVNGKLLQATSDMESAIVNGSLSDIQSALAELGKILDNLPANTNIDQGILTKAQQIR
mgnify:CR=1 FL=1